MRCTFLIATLVLAACVSPQQQVQQRAAAQERAATIAAQRTLARRRLVIGLRIAGLAARIAKRLGLCLLPLPCGVPYAAQRLGHTLPALRPECALLVRVPLGPRPSLHRLRGRS